MSAGKLAVVVASVALWVGSGASAEAQSQCKVDTDCTKGMVCQVTATSVCGGSTPTPAANPAPPADCDAGTCGAKRPAPTEPIAPVPPCTPQEYRSCVPGACMSDSDCGDGLVCHERRRGSCTTFAIPPCEPGSKCSEPQPPVCTETVDHICVPRYLLPCQQAADCGAGFTCEPQSRCGCGSSGTAGAAASAGGTPPSDPAELIAPPKDGGMPMPAADAGVPAAGDAPPPPDCGCQPTSEKYCKVIEVACRADADCAPLFTCRQSVTATTPSAGPACFVPPGGDGGTCSGAPLPPQPPPPVYRCEPPYQSIDVDSISSGHKTEPGSAVPMTPSNPTTTTPPPVDRPVPTTYPNTGTPGQATGGSTAGQPEAAPVPQAPQHVKSCTIATPGSTGSNLSIWVALVALAVVSRARRRNRRAT